MESDVHSGSTCILISVSQFGDFNDFVKPNSVKNVLT